MIEEKITEIIEAKEAALWLNGIRKLPRHQDIKTRIAVENCLENL